MDEIIPELEPPQEPDYYLDLGLQQTATLLEIKRAHHSLAKKHHPDKQAPGKRTDAHDFRRVSIENSKW
jgi:DnaJ-class molecular chaperone